MSNLFYKTDLDSDEKFDEMTLHEKKL